MNGLPGQAHGVACLKPHSSSHRRRLYSTTFSDRRLYGLRRYHFNSKTGDTGIPSSGFFHSSLSYLLTAPTSEHAHYKPDGLVQALDYPQMLAEQNAVMSRYPPTERFYQITSRTADSRVSKPGKFHRVAFAVNSAVSL